MKLVLAVSLVAALVLFTGPAYSSDHDHRGIVVAPVTGGLVLGMHQRSPGKVHTSAAEGSPTDVVVVDVGTDLRDHFCFGTNWNIGCDPEDLVESPEAVLTPGLVAAAFRRLPLPAAELVVQPPNGRTLVNFETNFYTEQGEFTRAVRLLGRRVELRIWPSGFGWRFGDGERRESTSPGAAYPHLEITHSYARTGRVAPSVDVTYAAQFRVGGGPWRDVAGTVTIPGEPRQLRVVEARPVLVGG